MTGPSGQPWWIAFLAVGLVAGGPAGMAWQAGDGGELVLPAASAGGQGVVDVGFTVDGETVRGLRACPELAQVGELGCQKASVEDPWSYEPAFRGVVDAVEMSVTWQTRGEEGSGLVVVLSRLDQSGEPVETLARASGMPPVSVHAEGLAQEPVDGVRVSVFAEASQAGPVGDVHLGVKEQAFTVVGTIGVTRA